MGCGRSIPLSERDPESSEEESRVSDVRNSSNINNHNGERNRRASDVDQGESNNVTRSRGEGIENDGTEETSSSSIRSRTDTDMWQRHHMMRASACEPTKSLINTQNDKAVGHFFKGSGFVEEDKYDEACKEFTIAIDLREDFATAYLMRGRVYEQLDELQDALNDFTKAVKLRSDYVAAFISRGRVYNKLHQYDNAIEDCTVAIDISPEEATAFQTRAGAYQSKGDLDKAMEDFERAGLLSEQKLCVVCLDNPRSTRIHPCLHAVLCAPCAQDLLSMKVCANIAFTDLC